MNAMGTLKLFGRGVVSWAAHILLLLVILITKLYDYLAVCLPQNLTELTALGSYLIQNKVNSYFTRCKAITYMHHN